MVTDWSLLARVRTSSYRERTLIALDEPRTPAQLETLLKLRRTHISRSLRELLKLGLITCLTPDTPRYRVYQRTTTGDELATAIRATRA